MSVNKRPSLDGFMTISARHIDPSTILFSEKVRSYCKYPYPMPNPTHPDGCPNHGKNPLCPPNAPYRPDILTIYDTFVLVWVKFDIAAYVEMMKERHPGWTSSQLRNSRLWQGTVKKTLRGAIGSRFPHIDEILGAGSGFPGCQSMESAGINVFTTLARNKIPLDKKAKDVVTLVALLLMDSKKPRTKVSRL